MDDSQRAHAELEAKRLFREMDTNGDGSLTVREVMEYTSRHHQGASHEWPASMQNALDGFIAADLDSSLSLTEEEFVQHYVQSQA
ncbi:EF-hand domain-containing protein [Streptomyces sp. NPDC008121]|uniref:EF-hand domain-containing protein n=1 Tax=Streptomyces sp. NPDC008121 TaxID=3364809 RepID=UPI0036EE431C